MVTDKRVPWKKVSRNKVLNFGTKNVLMHLRLYFLRKKVPGIKNSLLYFQWHFVLELQKIWTFLPKFLFPGFFSETFFLGNRRYKFRPVVFEVSSSVGNPVSWYCLQYKDNAYFVHNIVHLKSSMYLKMLCLTKQFFSLWNLIIFNFGFSIKVTCICFLQKQGS